MLPRQRFDLCIWQIRSEAATGRILAAVLIVHAHPNGSVMSKPCRRPCMAGAAIDQAGFDGSGVAKRASALAS